MNKVSNPVKYFDSWEPEPYVSVSSDVSKEVGLIHNLPVIDICVETFIGFDENNRRIDFTLKTFAVRDLSIK